MHENIWTDLTPEVPVVSGSLAIFPVPGKDEPQRLGLHADARWVLQDNHADM